jgi:hypothetical protein
MGMIDRRLENQWDRQLGDGLPDSRLQNRERKRVFRANMWWEPVFCTSCSRGPFGLITADWSPHVFYVCDGCVSAHGAPPGVAEAEVPQVQSAKKV